MAAPEGGMPPSALVRRSWFRAPGMLRLLSGSQAPPSGRRRLATSALFLTASLVALDQVADFVQRKLIYFPRRPGWMQKMANSEAEKTKQFLGTLGYEVHTVPFRVPPVYSMYGLRASFQQRAYLVMPAVAETCPSGTSEPVECGRSSRLWIVAGGNAMYSTDWLPFVASMLQKSPAGQGAAFLLLDYPGYGENEGPTCTGLSLRAGEAATGAALEFLQDRGRLPKAVGFLGHSLGCAAVMQLAAGVASDRLPGGPPADRIVLSSPFTSIPNMGKALFGNGGAVSAIIRVIALTSRHAWDNEANLRRLAAVFEGLKQGKPTVHILHSTNDEIVPVEMGRTLHELSRELGFAGSFREVAESTHNDILDLAEQDFFRLMAETDTRTGKL